MCGLMGLEGQRAAEPCITIALWGFVVAAILGHWQGNIQQLVEKYQKFKERLNVCIRPTKAAGL